MREKRSTDSPCVQGWSKWEPGDLKEDGKRPRDICAVKKGYGMGIGAMYPIEGATLYSVLSKLPRHVVFYAMSGDHQWWAYC